MNNKIDIKGLWKLPSHSKYSRAGILKYDPEKNKIILELIGTFSTEEERLFEEFYDRIDGFSDNGQKITLLDCDGHNSEAMPGIRSSEFDCGKMILSRNIQVENNLNYKFANIKFENFDAFVGQTGFNQSINGARGNARKYEMVLKNRTQKFNKFVFNERRKIKEAQLSSL